MSFRQSASNIRVDDGHILRASIQNGNGDWVDAEIDLDGFIGNSNGRFEWGGESMSLSFRNLASPLLLSTCSRLPFFTNYPCPSPPNAVLSRNHPQAWYDLGHSAI